MNELILGNMYTQNICFVFVSLRFCVDLVTLQLQLFCPRAFAPLTLHLGPPELSGTWGLLADYLTLFQSKKGAKPVYTVCL